jgi:hypothetical protein
MTMDLPSTRDYPPGVGIANILTGQEYDIRPVELDGQTTYVWACRPCGGQTSGVNRDWQTEAAAFESYVDHYARKHN